MNATDQLLEMKEKIENLKTKKARAEGEQNQILTQLKSMFGTADRKEIEKKLSKLALEVKELEKDVSEKLQALEGELGDC